MSTLVEKINLQTGKRRLGELVAITPLTDNGAPVAMVRWEDLKHRGPVQQVIGRRGIFHAKIVE